MTRGQRLVESLPLKARFYDAHERRSYLRMVAIASRIVDEPQLIEAGRAYLDRFARNDPHQTSAYETWIRVLDGFPPEQIAARLLEDTDAGALLRDTAPVFVVITPEEAWESWRVA
jgi:hypothetical protein